MTTELDRRLPAVRLAAAHWLVPAMSLALAACAAGGGQTSARDPMAALEERAVARWQLLIDRKPEQAYEYLTPGYRSTRPLADYRGAPRSPTVEWTGIRWHQAECEQPDSCQVKLLLDYQMSAPSAGNIPGIQELSERWLRLDGTWYHLPED